MAKLCLLKVSNRKSHFYNPTAFKVPHRHQSLRQIAYSAVMHTKLDKSILQRLPSLTARERQIAALVCVGHANKIIARKLHVSEGTVKTHLHAIYLKLGIENRASLIAAIDSAQNDRIFKI